MQKRRWWTDLTLAVAAIFIAFVLWLIAKQDDLGRTWIKAAIILENQPENMDVTLPDEVDILVQYPKSANKNIVSRNFSIKLDVASVFDVDPLKWGKPDGVKTTEYALEDDDVISQRVNRSVQVIGFEPRVIKLSASLLTQRFRVEVPMTGELAEQYELLAEPRPSPDTLVGTASRETLNRLSDAGDVILTAPVDISPMTESKQVFPELQIPKGLTLLDHRDRRIMVNVALREKNVRRMIEKAPVELFALDPTLTIQADPATVDVVVDGPFSKVQAITPEDISFTTTGVLVEEPGKKQTVGIEAKLKRAASAALDPAITVRECQPSRITVEFQRAEVQN